MVPEELKDEGAPHQTHPPTEKHQEPVHQDEVREDGDTLPRRCLIRRRGIPGQKPDVIQEGTPIQEVKNSDALLTQSPEKSVVYKTKNI